VGEPLEDEKLTEHEDFGLGTLTAEDLEAFGLPPVFPPLPPGLPLGNQASCSDVDIVHIEYPHVAEEVKSEEVEATEYAISEVSEDAGREAHAQLLPEEPDVKPHGFVVAEVAKKRRRLHFVGNCYRRPGQHYRNFTIYGDVVPKETDFDKVCTQCFPRGVLTEAEKLEEDVANEDSDSSSTTNSSV
jgi:hypothetical protein